MNGDLLPQTNELGPSTGFSSGAFNRYADGYKWPWAREFSAEIQRQLPLNMVVSAGYTRREKLGNFGSRNVAVPESSYQRLTVTEVNSGRSVTVYNQDPALRSRQDFVFTNAPELNSTYNGGDISIDKRMSNGWMMTGGISMGKTVGWVGNTDLNNPNSKEFARGIVGNDTPFSFRLSGLYELPLAIQMSGTFQHQKGFPELTQVSVGNNTIALTQGTTSIIVEPRGTSRLPNLSQLDMSFRKVFRAGGRIYQPRVDIYNLMYTATVINRVTTLGASYGAVGSIQRGALVKFGMHVDF